MADPAEVPPLDEIVERSGIAYPNGRPYTHIAFTIVVWQDADRLAALLDHVRPAFETLAVVVQESTDGTLDVAHAKADLVLVDAHRGYGDASYGPVLLPALRTPWVLRVDSDEWPSDDLLDSLSCATWWADHGVGTKGVWIPFRSWVDGIEYEEQHAHLRLFHRAVGWPATMHSRPPIEDGVIWRTGHIAHPRTLDKLVTRYLGYLRLGRKDQGHTAHNLMMIRSACEGTAAIKGWEYVRSFDWWPQVEAEVFQGGPR